METRQKLEVWPIVDAAFEPCAPVADARQVSETLHVEVKRRIPKVVQVTSFIGSVLHG